MMKTKRGVRIFLGRGFLFFCAIFIVLGFLSAQSKLVVSVPEARVHLSPDFKSQVIDTLTAGEVLSLYQSGQKHGEWFYVSYYSQARKALATGFIHVSQAKVVIDSEEIAPHLRVQDDEETSRSAMSSSSDKVEPEQEPTSEGALVRGHSVKIGAIYFMPSGQSFRDIYGSGLGFGGELNLGLWKSISVWVFGNYYSNDGKLPVTKEATDLSLLALGGGPKFILSRSGISPYLGIGPVLYIYKEENSIGLAEGTGIGFIGQFGLSAQVVRGLIVDVSLNYTYCKVQPQNIKANVGGLQLGLSIGYAF